MAESLKLLKVAMLAFGVIFCLIYPLAIVWPSGWSWHDGPPLASHYFMMIVAVYVTLGVMLVLGARDPVANLPLVRFTIWSSLVHAVVMAVQATTDPTQHGHLAGDVPALLLVVVVLGGLVRAVGRRGLGGMHANA